MGLRKFTKQTSIKTKEFFHKILSNKSLWYVSLFAFLIPFNNSLLSLLGGFFYAEHPNISILTTELINVSISGWAIFTMFIRIDTDSIVPPESIRQSEKETQKLLTAMYFVPSARISTYFVSFILDGKQSIELFGFEVNSYLVFLIAVGMSLVFGIRLYKLSQKRKVSAKKLNQENLTIYSLDIQQTFAKLASRLTEDEQGELSMLTLHTEKINKVTFINLAKVCWSGLFLAWLFEVCVELIQRL